MGGMLAFLGRDMAVDLGTANTLVYVPGRGVALNEPVLASGYKSTRSQACSCDATAAIAATPTTVPAVGHLIT